MLAIPAFGIALAYTVVTTYVPVLLNEISGPAVIGALIGLEGALALFVPIFVGGWSDSLRTRWGGRLPFLVFGAALTIAALVFLPLAAGSLVLVAVTLAVFFIAYFVYYTPYYALFPDFVDEDARGRSQGFQGGLRSAGLLLGMAGGAALLHLWKPLPFVVGATILGAVTAGLLVAVRERVASQESGKPKRATKGESNGFAASWQLFKRDRRIRTWALANACWEAAIGALRTFVVLYFTVGLGFSLLGAAAALGLVGVAAIVAAPVAGKLADKYGAQPVMHVSVWVFAVGVVPPLVTTNPAFVAAILPVAFAAVALLTLPWALLMDLLPDKEDHGAGASIFGSSRGVGIIAGPLVAGLAIKFTNDLGILSFKETEGYAATFGVTMLFLLVSIPVLRRLAGSATEAPQGQQENRSAAGARGSRAS